MLHTIKEAFEAQVEKTPNDCAIAEQGRSVTYAELDMISKRIAARFPEKVQMVGLVMDHGIEMIASILAVTRMGAAYIPAEPSFPRERIRSMFTQCAVEFVLTQEKYCDRFENFDTLCVGQEECSRLDPIHLSEEEVPASDSPAYVLYTSGTTGVPKGIIVENRNVCHYARAFINEFKPVPGDVILQNSVCTFDIFVEEVFPVLFAGGALAIPDAAIRNDFESLIRFIDEKKVTIVSGFPYLFADMNKLESIPGSVRLLISGGDVLRDKQVDNLLGQASVYNTYGPSETTVCATYFRCNDTEPCEDGTYPIGTAVKGTEVYVVNNGFEEVECGERGEIVIFGDGVARGYVDSRERLEGFTYALDGRWCYRSGDLGYLLPDGNIVFLERKDNQVMIMGRRVEPQEVENVLEQCQGVGEAIVVAHVDENNHTHLTANIVSNNGVLDISAIRQELSDYLPDFMIPEVFIQRDHMPLLANGKVDKSALSSDKKER